MFRKRESLWATRSPPAPVGATLVAGTERPLREDGVTRFEPTVPFYDALESAFLRACWGTDDGVPYHLRAAVDDARAFAREDYAAVPEPRP